MEFYKNSQMQYEISALSPLSNTSTISDFVPVNYHKYIMIDLTYLYYANVFPFIDFNLNSTFIIGDKETFVKLILISI